MAKLTSEGAQATAIEVINSLSSVSVKKIQGKKPVYITVEATGMRPEARAMLSAALKKKKLVNYLRKQIIFSRILVLIILRVISLLVILYPNLSS